MTAVALTYNRKLNWRNIIGESIAWPRLGLQLKFFTEEQPQDPAEPIGLWVSNGVSPSATVVQQQVMELAPVLHATEQLESSWTQLASAAQSGDAETFAHAYQSIDWSSRTPAEFMRAIQWALAAGAHLAARTLATTGATRYPDHAELQKAARILAPPKVLRRNLPPDKTQQANQEWLRTHRLEYRGQWVALRAGQLLAAADSFQTLTAQITIAPEILFTKVI